MNERPGDRHTLLLTAGKLAWQIRQPAPEPKPVEEGSRGREGPCPRPAGDDQRHRRILHGREGREEIE